MIQVTKDVNSIANPYLYQIVLDVGNIAAPKFRTYTASGWQDINVKGDPGSPGMPGSGGSSLSLSNVTFGDLPLPSNLLTKWRKAVAYVNTPIGIGFNYYDPFDSPHNGFQTTGQAQLLCWGDSTFHRTSASNSVSLVDHIRKNLSTQMPIAEGIVWCCNNSEPRIVPGAYTLINGGGWGNVYLEAAGSGADLSFTPGYTFNTVNIYWGQTNSSTYGTVNVKVDGISVGGLNGLGSSYSWQKTTYNVPTGSRQLAISAPTGGKFAIFGIECFDSTVPAMRVIMGGVDGTAAIQWTTSPNPGWEGINAVDLIKPDLTLLMLAKNNPGNFDTIQTALNPLVTKVKLYGDIVLCAPYPSLDVPFSSQEPVANGILALAASSNSGAIDLFHCYSNGTGVAEAQAWFFGDSVHYSDIGTFDVARRMTNAISSSPTSTGQNTTTTTTVIVSASGGSGGGYMFSAQNSSFTAVSGYMYAVDTSTGDKTATISSTGAIPGGLIKIIHDTAGYTLTITGSNQGNITSTIAGNSFEFFYNGSQWKLLS